MVLRGVPRQDSPREKELVVTVVPLDVEVPEAYKRALVYFTSPQGSIRHVQQNEAVRRLAALTRDMGLSVGAWVHADSRGLWPPTKAEYSVWKPEVLPDQITLYRGARAQAAKRYAWSPQLDCAAMFARNEWLDEPWRRGKSNLGHESELWVYKVDATREDMVNADLVAWHSTSFRGYEELIFASPERLPDPVPVGRIGASGKLEERDPR